MSLDSYAEMVRKRFIKTNRNVVIDKKTNTSKRWSEIEAFEEKYTNQIKKNLHSVINKAFLEVTTTGRKNYGELLYDRHGEAVAIKSNGKILEILEGEE